MKLSAPIHVLKNQAKKLKAQKSIPLNKALDVIAQREGFSSWSLLNVKNKESLPSKEDEILNYLNDGDLVLIASRPGLGKTTFTLKLLYQALKEERHSFFFSLEYTHRDVAEKMAGIDQDIGHNNPFFKFDFSDEISANYIIERTKELIKPGSLIGIDYLQLLDQKRTNPELQEQVDSLKSFAKEKNCILIFISQVDRKFEYGEKQPSLEDIRLPNPIDLNLFNKVIFLENDKKSFIRPKTFEFV
ncbi:MAG: DNA helicase [Oligoflexia bacterium]|nr:DNA helicase [Oligoflexia bacterium]